MFDFPNSPTTNQIVTGPGGQLYQWNGTAWTIAPVSVAFAPIASPAFTGNPTAPTPSPGDSDTSLATTAFVAAAMGATAYAPLASPVFTGNPTAPTPPAGDADTSLATTAFVAASTATALANVGRNLLHNSMFNVAQRGVGSWTTSGYGLDRWQGAVSGDTFSWGQNTHTDTTRAQIGDEAATYYLANTFTGTSGAGALTVIWQPIEDVRRLAGKTVTVSFWATASVGTLKLGVSFDQNFGSGGSPSATVQVNGQSVTLSTTWTRYSMTFTLPSVSGKTLGTTANTSNTSMFLWYSSGSTNNVRSGNVGAQTGSNVINIWGVQLEIGPTATPLEKLDPVTQLQQCQRFYCTGNIYFAGAGIAGNASIQGMGLPVTMRVLPTTITSSFGTQTNCTGGTVAALNSQAVYATATVTASAAQTIYFCNFTASADL